MAYEKSQTRTPTSSKNLSKNVDGENTIPRIISQHGIQIVFDRSSPSNDVRAELETNGYIIKKGQQRTAGQAENILDGMGFSLVEAEELSPGINNIKEFSLIGSTNVDETIQNSKITDPDLSMLTPIKHTTTDKFKSADDAFYTLDHERPLSVKQITQQEKLSQIQREKYNKIVNNLSSIIKKSNNPMVSKINQRGRTR